MLPLLFCEYVRPLGVDFWQQYPYQLPQLYIASKVSGHLENGQHRDSTLTPGNLIEIIRPQPAF